MNCQLPAPQLHCGAHVFQACCCHLCPPYERQPLRPTEINNHCLNYNTCTRFGSCISNLLQVLAVLHMQFPILEFRRWDVTVIIHFSFFEPQFQLAISDPENMSGEHGTELWCKETYVLWPKTVARKQRAKMIVSCMVEGYCSSLADSSYQTNVLLVPLLHGLMPYTGWGN